VTRAASSSTPAQCQCPLNLWVSFFVNPSLQTALSANKHQLHTLLQLASLDPSLLLTCILLLPASCICTPLLPLLQALSGAEYEAAAKKGVKDGEQGEGCSSDVQGMAAAELLMRPRLPALPRSCWSAGHPCVCGCQAPSSCAAAAAGCLAPIRARPPNPAQPNTGSWSLSGVLSKAKDSVNKLVASKDSEDGAPSPTGEEDLHSPLTTSVVFF
jgi:hypothetical protein